MNGEFLSIGQRDRENSGFNRGKPGIKSRVLCACWTMIQSEYAYKKEQARMQEDGGSDTIAQ